MSDKASLESLEMLLAAACNLLNQAAGEQKELEFEPVRENLKLIGSALVPARNMRIRLRSDHREAGILGIGKIEKAIASGISPSLNLCTMFSRACFTFSFIIIHLLSIQIIFSFL